MEKRTWLIDLRKAKNLKQSDVAALCEITQAYYARIELGTKTPSIATAKRIADQLDFPWPKFFEN